MRRRAGRERNRATASAAGLAAAIALLTCAATARAGAPAGRAAAAAPPARAVAVEVRGIASRKDGTDPRAKWQRLKVGDVLAAKTLVCTGMGGEVVVQLSDRGLVKLKPGTKIGIAEVYKRGKVMTCRLGLKFGTIRVRVDGARGPNDLSVSTPVAILSVRGCGADIAFTERGLKVCVFEHKWHMRLASGREGLVRENECTDGKLTPSDKLKRRARHLAMGDAGKGLSGEDRDSIVDNGGGRAIFDHAAGDDGRWLFARWGGCPGGENNTPAGPEPKPADTTAPTDAFDGTPVTDPGTGQDSVPQTVTQPNGTDTRGGGTETRLVLPAGGENGRNG